MGELGQTGEGMNVTLPHQPHSSQHKGNMMKHSDITTHTVKTITEAVHFSHDEVKALLLAACNMDEATMGVDVIGETTMLGIRLEQVIVQETTR